MSAARPTLGGQVFVTALPGMSLRALDDLHHPQRDRRRHRHLRGGQRALSLPAVEPELRRQQRLSHPGRSAASPPPRQTPTQAAVGTVLDANVNNATGDFATVLGAHGLQHAPARRPRRPCTAISRQQLRRLLEFDGPGRAALHEQLPVAGRWRQHQQQQGHAGGSLRRGVRRRRRPHDGRLGRAARWHRHHRRQSADAGTLTYNACAFLRRVAPRQTWRQLSCLGFTVGYTSGQQWVGGFDGKGISNTVTAGLYGGYAQPGPVYVDGILQATHTAAIKCGATSRSPACSPARHRASPGPTTFRPDRVGAIASILAVRRQRVRHPVRPPAGLHRHSERLHRQPARRTIAVLNVAAREQTTNSLRLCWAPGWAARKSISSGSLHHAASVPELG